MKRRDLPSENLPSVTGLPFSDNFLGEPSLSQRAFFKRNVWPWISDIIGVACIFVMLFGSLFIGVAAQ